MKKNNKKKKPLEEKKEETDEEQDFARFHRIQYLVLNLHARDTTPDFFVFGQNCCKNCLQRNPLVLLAYLPIGPTCKKRLQWQYQQKQWVSKKRRKNCLQMPQRNKKKTNNNKGLINWHTVCFVWAVTGRLWLDCPGQ